MREFDFWGKYVNLIYCKELDEEMDALLHLSGARTRSQEKQLTWLAHL